MPVKSTERAGTKREAHTSEEEDIETDPPAMAEAEGIMVARINPQQRNQKNIYLKEELIP